MSCQEFCVCCVVGREKAGGFESSKLEGKEPRQPAQRHPSKKSKMPFPWPLRSARATRFHKDLKDGRT